ncbi:hypothetical protein [Elizabethkingia anophelis]|uniref:hypothetical protein n=1 Tax=Elizabethkingia anophelis TaxID=1117645 RepID=UPI0012B28D0B|nr:hypothetical protein [Elizabethkingia anophelis]MCL1034054.1 hypothetical protein [Elizabethkingia anophelis]MDV3662245.1 hypothetical protein [Elizabethkingia anophelis]QGN21850.1 hypothetical protein GJV56_04035 [Elizabethkingia anophelis]QNV08509.1 hypothetical protein EIY88_04030 [Elizabethkingia anophelis]UTF90254.1 hypothetical protein J2N93_04050 [Elizabethkingia anophelis]
MIQKAFIITILILSTLLFSAQTKINMEGKSFTGFITSMCVETTLPDPCAGHTDEMELHFKKDVVEIVSVRSKCNKTQRKSVSSKWRWISGNQIKIENFNYENQPLISGNILYVKNNQLIGKHGNRFTRDFTFEPLVKKRK